MEPHLEKVKKTVWTRIIDRYGLAGLYFISFTESAFFPIPVDVFMIPFIVSRPKQWKKIALWVTVTSILGGILGYYIGFALFETIGSKIIEHYNLSEELVRVGKLYNDHAFITVITAGFTPLPYKIFSIAAGIFKLSLPVFIIASIIGRGARFFLVGYLSAMGSKSSLWQRIKGYRYTNWVILGILLLAALFFFL